MQSIVCRYFLSLATILLALASSATTSVGVQLSQRAICMRQWLALGMHAYGWGLGRHTYGCQAGIHMAGIVMPYLVSLPSLQGCS